MRTIRRQLFDGDTFAGALSGVIAFNPGGDIVFSQPEDRGGVSAMTKLIHSYINGRLASAPLGPHMQGDRIHQVTYVLPYRMVIDFPRSPTLAAHVGESLIDKCFSRMHPAEFIHPDHYEHERWRCVIDNGTIPVACSIVDTPDEPVLHFNLAFRMLSHATDIPRFGVS